MNNNTNFKELCTRCEFRIFNPWESTKRMFLGSPDRTLSHDTHDLFNQCILMDRELKVKEGTAMYDIFVVPYLNDSPDNFDEKTQTTILDKYELYGVLLLSNTPLVIVKYGFTEEVPDEMATVLKHVTFVTTYLKIFNEELFTPVLKEGASLIMQEIVRSKSNASAKTQKR